MPQGLVPGGARPGPGEDPLVPLEPAGPEERHGRVLRADEKGASLEDVLSRQPGVLEALWPRLGGDQSVEAAAIQDEALVGVPEAVLQEPASDEGGIGLRLEDEAPESEPLAGGMVEDPDHRVTSEPRDDGDVDAVLRLENGEAVSDPERESGSARAARREGAGLREAGGARLARDAADRAPRRQEAQRKEPVVRPDVRHDGPRRHHAGDRVEAILLGGRGERAHGERLPRLGSSARPGPSAKSPRRLLRRLRRVL